MSEDQTISTQAEALEGDDLSAQGNTLTLGQDLVDQAELPAPDDAEGEDEADDDVDGDPEGDDDAEDEDAEDDEESEGEAVSGDQSAAGTVSGASKHVRALDAEGDIAADYLEELLDIADLDGDIDTFTEDDRAHVSIVTTSDTLVGKNGEVLDALQELARLAVMTETGHRSRLMLDVAGHRDQRRKELRMLAKDAIAEVQTSGEPVRLEAMNPFERKVVHDVVAASGLVSESEGAEPNRRVVVQPA